MHYDVASAALNKKIRRPCTAKATMQQSCFLQQKAADATMFGFQLCRSFELCKFGDKTPDIKTEHRF